MKIYIHRNSSSYGPYAPNYINEFLDSGLLKRTDNACIAGANGWSKLDNLLDSMQFRNITSEKSSMRKVKSGELEWIEEENGKIAYAKIIEKNPFTGLFELSHKNGVKRRVKSYKNGKLHGEWTEWREDGTIKQYRYYEYGVRNGSFKSWHHNGELKSEGNYYAGKKSGLWINYNEMGEACSRTTF